MPSLMQQLVCGSGAELLQCRFLTHEKTNLGGWDGIVEAKTAGFHVPIGFSGWELSRTTAQGMIEKACADAEKRTSASGDLIPANSTLVIVTLQVWPRRRREDGSYEESHEHKNNWGREQAHRLGWREVRVLDALDISAWIARQIGTAIWLAHVMGRNVDGAHSLSRLWDELKTLRPNLSPSVFLAGRKSFVDALEKWLTASDNHSFEIRSWSHEEVRDAVAAWSSSRNESVATTNAVIPAVAVTSPDAWRVLSQSKPAVLLLADGGLELTPEQVSAAVAGGHRVLVRTHAGRSRSPGERLPPLNRDTLADALRACGIDHNKAWQWAGESGGSGVVLKRILHGDPGTPAWALGPLAGEWAPIILFGAWESESEADRDRIAEVFGRPYAEVENLIRPWLSANHPMVKEVQGEWRVLSREDAWRFLSPWLREEHYRRFQAVATAVLQELNPRYDMPADQRIYAGIYKKQPKHSHRLRRAMAETLCLLGIHAPDNGPGTKAGEPVRKVVEQVLENSGDWRLWASLDHALPLIAEASPAAFLTALETDLRSESPATVELFRQGGDHVFADNPHVEVMWALEGLMWERQWVTRSAIALARLAALDPGGKCSPRPMGVLREAFLPWYPQCCLNVRERCQLIDSLVLAQPTVGWKLLLGLLPKTRDVSSPRHRPRFREVTAAINANVSRDEYWEQVAHVARRLVEHAGSDSELWKELVEEFDSLPDEVFDAAIKQLETVCVGMAPTERDILWEALRGEVAKHRYFATAEWAMSSPRLGRMEALVHDLQPIDPVRRDAWLFASGPSACVPNTTCDTPHEETERLAEEARRAVLVGIAAQGGLPEIRRLLDLVDGFYARRIGYSIARYGILVEDTVILPAWLESEVPTTRAFAEGYASGRFHAKDSAEGWRWLSELGCQKWGPTTFAALSGIFPLGEETWRQVDALGAEFADAYWRKSGAWGQGLNESEVARMIRELNARQRPLVALDGICSCKLYKIAVSEDLLLETLEAVREQNVSQASPTNEQRGQIPQMDTYHIHTALEMLQNSTTLTEDQAARVESLEWFLIPLFEHHGTPKLLHRRLVNSAEDFVDAVIMARHKSDNPAPLGKAADISGQERNLAEASDALLDLVRQLPGTTDDNKIDESRFMSWVNAVRDLASQKKYLNACERMIGKWLLYSPAEPDGQWPCTPVCRLLNGSGSEAMKDGFLFAIFNNQGWPGPLRDGMSMSGLDERRDAVKKLGELAQMLDLQFPIVADLLREAEKSQQQVLNRRLRDDD